MLCEALKLGYSMTYIHQEVFKRNWAYETICSKCHSHGRIKQDKRKEYTDSEKAVIQDFTKTPSHVAKLLGRSEKAIQTQRSLLNITETGKEKKAAVQMRFNNAEKSKWGHKKRVLLMKIPIRKRNSFQALLFFLMRTKKSRTGS